MTTRQNVGSWLEGGPSGEGDHGAGLGLAPSGPGSAAPLGRRALALVLDWTLSLLLASAFFSSSEGPFWERADPMVTLAVFAVENLLLVGTLGFTVGHRVLGLRVRRAGATPDGPLPDDGRAPGLGRAAVRTVLLCLVIPAVVWDSDGRGLHDRSAGTAIVRR
ncbi:RDD family protein [Cellulomonas sp. PSBB021]|uniref:RDD family protein n=1 Tax=Cellulomonas sp. PSBB021 TaxID=2003551 RepID=UPI000B8D2F6C|nr:RDD family protein [Cellulomonas sp. PSBB021]ASR54775.1 RDD family protein [Cellulomonas sp. PSBB021]